MKPHLTDEEIAEITYPFVTRAARAAFRRIFTIAEYSRRAYTSCMAFGLLIAAALFVAAAVAGEKNALLIPAAVLAASAIANLVAA